MREITAKFNSSCDRCGAEILKGDTVAYEKITGIFCLECMPTDTEEIRDYRQRKANRKADRYDKWAEKRQRKAEELYQQDEHYRVDIAFNTQPGHIPERQRVIKRTEKAFEHASKAKQFNEKANSLRTVRVAGDAEKARQDKRNEVLSWIRVGMKVDTGHYGIGEVKKINKKTAKIDNCGSGQSYYVNVDLSFISKI